MAEAAAQAQAAAWEPAPTPLNAPEYAGDLGAGLVRRWSTAADQEKIGLCLGTAFRNAPDAPLNQRMINRVAVMFSPGFPSMGPGDYAVVEDASRPERPIVACACLWRQTWSLDGLPLAVGRPEYVATEAEYRNRGLVRGLFEMLHARSAARGDDIQVITGIPYYYRLFGYEYALDLWGARLVDIEAVPAPKEGVGEICSLRLATAGDAPAIAALYDQERSRSLVWCEVGEHEWRYYVTAWDEPHLRSQDPKTSGLARRLYVITDAEGRDSGFVLAAGSRRDDKFHVYWLALPRAVNWQALMPSLLRALRTLAQQAPAAQADTPPLRSIALILGRLHKAYTVLGERLAPSSEYSEYPYAWYVRVEDIAGLVRRIAPVLERRLGGSVLASYTGELVVNFYRGGLRLRFDGGRLAAVEPWRAPPYGDEAQAGCPESVFTQLLLGYRSLAELREIYPDVWTEDEAAVLLDVLLPKQPSNVLMFGYT